MARRSARALVALATRGLTLGDVLTDAAIRNAMVVHAAFGGSTNLLLHIPAIAFAAGLRRPTVDDWHEINVKVPRLVSVLPNGPYYHPTVRAYLAGGVPEVMLHLRGLGLLDLSVLTVAGEPLERMLEWWEASERRKRLRERLFEQDGVDPDDVIMSPSRAKEHGLTSTVTFPRGNLAPEGSVIKSTAIDPSVVDADGVYRKTGPARVFTRETRRDRRDQRTGRPADPAWRRAGPDGPRAGRRGHGGDLPDHRGAAIPLVRQAGRRAHRRPVLRGFDRCVHRPRQPRGTGRRPDRQGSATAT